MSAASSPVEVMGCPGESILRSFFYVEASAAVETYCMLARLSILDIILAEQQESRTHGK